LGNEIVSKMESRRKFIKTAGAGITASLVAPNILASSVSAEKPIRIGIIGAENSHTAGFGKLFNIDKKISRC
jgi:hypothetical protein